MQSWIHFLYTIIGDSVLQLKQVALLTNKTAAAFAGLMYTPLRNETCRACVCGKCPIKKNNAKVHCPLHISTWRVHALGPARNHA